MASHLVHGAGRRCRDRWVPTLDGPPSAAGSSTENVRGVTRQVTDLLNQFV